MIISIGGKPGSGKSTVAKLLAKKLKLKHYSNGDFMREMAKERNLSLLELSKIAETDKSIDLELDKRQIELGKKENNFIIDSRLGFHFIPNSKKVFLDADIEIRAKRILNDRRDTEKNASLKEAMKNILTREKSESKRYLQYYNLDPYNPKNYDLVVDTTNENPESVTNKVLKSIN
jgi:CMP/dCMP kinase